MKMIKKMIGGLVLSITLCSISTFHGVGVVQAKSKSSEAYNEFLTNQDKAEKIAGYFGGRLEQAEFALVDLNKDGIKEMIVSADNAYHTALLTYVKGKVKCIGGSFSGGFTCYPNKRLYSTMTIHTGACITSYYKFNGKKLIKVAEKTGYDYQNAVTGEPKNLEETMSKYNDIFAPYKYTVKKKTVSSKKYKAYVKKLKKGAKKKNVKFVKNTFANRNKYLK